MKEEGETVIEANSVSKKFKDVYALKDVSLKVRKNSIFGLLGSNGAGKSTLIHILIGLLNPSSGQIKIFNEVIKKRYTRKMKREVAIVPQKISLYEDLSIYDNLFFFGKSYGLKRKEILDRIIELNSIFKLGDLNKKIRILSGGYQRRVSFAVALIGNPSVLFLDEAMVGIDLETRKIIIDLLMKLKKDKTIILTTHSMSEAQDLCDYVYFLHRGKKVLEGETQDVLKNSFTTKKTIMKITFKDEETINSGFRLLKDDFGDLYAEGNILTLKIRSGEYAVSNILGVMERLEKYKPDILNLEIKKPDLGDIILETIKSSELEPY